MNNLQEIIKSKQIHYFKNSWYYLQTELIKISEEIKTKFFDVKKSEFNKNIGPIPSIIKLILVNSSVQKSDGPLEIISGNYTFDIHNYIIDKIIRYNFLKKRNAFISSQRKFFLFDGRIRHRRYQSTKIGFRLATIINLES